MEKEYFLFLLLKEGCTILFILIKMRIEVQSGRWELNLKREKVNTQKC